MKKLFKIFFPLIIVAIFFGSLIYASSGKSEEVKTSSKQSISEKEKKEGRETCYVEMQWEGHGISSYTGYKMKQKVN